MNEIEMDESWVVNPARAVSQRVERLIRGARTLALPPGLADGEAVRAWILGLIAQQAATDVSEKEREETAAWSDRVTTALASSLWEEYRSYYPERR